MPIFWKILRFAAWHQSPHDYIWSTCLIETRDPSPGEVVREFLSGLSLYLTLVEDNENFKREGAKRAAGLTARRGNAKHASGAAYRPVQCARECTFRSNYVTRLKVNDGRDCSGRDSSRRKFSRRRRSPGKIITEERNDGSQRTAPGQHSVTRARRFLLFLYLCLFLWLRSGTRRNRRES